MPMMDLEQIQMLVYQHVTQLTLIDYRVSDAFDVALQTAALAFDDEFIRAGLERARKVIVDRTDHDKGPASSMTPNAALQGDQGAGKSASKRTR
jgi:hypothetical protein